MTVKELIIELSNYPEDLIVGIEKDPTEDYDGGVFVVEDVFFDKESNGLIIEA